MQVSQPFVQLPRRFCTDTLAAEVAALPASAWVPHPSNYPGNDAVLLITPHGQSSNAFTGPMAPTEHLLACPYILEIMAEIGAVWGRSRLMGLGPGATVPPHVDINYYWRTHLRVHIPIITTPKVIFTCGDDRVHMAAGECWVFDSFRMHNVHNGGTEKRIHLVLDTVGGQALWELIEQAQSAAGSVAPTFCPPDGRNIDAIAYERTNAPRIMSPWEIRCHIAYVGDHVVEHRLADPVFRRLDKFAEGWAGAWAQYGDSDEGIPAYNALIGSVQKDLAAMAANAVMLRNDVPLVHALAELIFRIAVPAVALQPVAAERKLA